MRIAFIAATFGLAVSVVTACDRQTTGDVGDTGQPRTATSGDEGFLSATEYDTNDAGQILAAAVKMKATCKKDDVEFVLRPWKLKASRGADIEFDVQPTVSEVEIYAKDLAHWPFEGASPLRVKAGGGSTPGAKIKADADITRKYSYGVRFDCKVDDVSDSVDVDPDIIIFN